MDDYIIKPAGTDTEIRGRGYVHYTAWQETYRGLASDGYLEQMSLEKCVEIAFRFPDNILVARTAKR